MVELKKLKLLLVEDDKAMRNKFRDILSIFFDEITIAKDGYEAFKLYENNKFNLVITDYVMPRLDGYALCKKIREDNSSIPLIIISNYSEKEKLLEFMPLKLSQYLVKPLNYSDLISTFKNIIIRLNNNNNNFVKINIKINIEYSYQTKEIIKNNLYKIQLTNLEYKIFELLIENKTKIVTFEQISYFLDEGKEISTNSIRNIIYRLRKKINNDSIVNINSLGYKLNWK